MTFWDYATGTPFQNMEDIPQPGSLEAEAGIFCSTYDMTGTRLITGGADKTIKVRARLSELLTSTNGLLAKGVCGTDIMIISRIVAYTVVCYPRATCPPTFASISSAGLI